MILRAVRAELDARLAPGEAFAVALSGGRDSVVLLDVLLREARHRVRGAIHVHHGLSPNADAWASFCETLCGERGLPLAVRRVAVERGPQTSLESEARRARYEALAGAARSFGVATVALAHHRDDQAETLLLQLLRGAGPRGLASMPAMRDDASGVRWWRPLLAVPRTEIDAYARHRGMGWVDDESNEAVHHARNAIRHVVMPALVAVNANAGVTLARAAGHQAEAARLADDLAAIDAREAFDGATLSQQALSALPAHRARNLLRWFLRARGLPAPSTARLGAMHAQLRAARGDAALRLCHAGVEIGLYKGRIHVHEPAPLPYEIDWDARQGLALPHGTLEVEEAVGQGIDADRVRGAALRVRPRSGGERMQLAGNRPRRALKHILQEAGLPPWQREALPLVTLGSALVAVPGVGVDAAWQAPPQGRGLVLTWHPGR
ncbi:MAG: tRNA lysidine(34) synthetase TilS [Burkholderiales bacterium]